MKVIYLHGGMADQVQCLSKFDRACAMIEWRELFPQAIVRHLQALYLDHDPILLTLQRDTHNGRRKKIS